jgi:hypothetical protein
VKPSDPLCHIGDCVVDPDEEPGISISTAPRATAQRRYADERGLAFQEVQCLRVYAHIYTRQEAWDEYGRERESDRRQEEKGVGWYFADPRWPVAAGVVAEGYYYDDCDDEGCHRPVSAEDLAYIEGPPTTVPDEWVPDDDCPAWYRTTRNDPAAIPAWECGEF